MRVDISHPVQDPLRTVPSALFHYKDDMEHIISFVEQEQLLDRKLWKLFVQQYRDRDDSQNCGWRGEYWGKMMMGACFLCEATGNNVLYTVLEETVCDMLTTQDDAGRISTYDTGHELHGWDIWCRKYVMIGMEYFLNICRDDSLKATILQSLCRQLDALLEKLGPDKIPVSHTSDLYRGLNSCSILEAIVRLYRLTDKKEYIDFATDIAKSGGSSICDLFTLALQDELMPYQYPVTKAYEMISCFEGLLELYRVTGDEKCKKASLNFTDRILETDFTVIGSCGCTHEFLDHSTVRQAKEETGPLMEETCVTISIMKMLYQAALLTGEPRYVDAFELSFYNAYLGAFNTNHITQKILLDEDPALHLKPLPFDSYSPLTSGYRGRGVGGFQIMREHEFYGCCACIASAGCGLFPKLELLQSTESLVLNLYAPGDINAITPQGVPLALSISTAYPADGTVRITVNPAEPTQFSLKLRVPTWSNGTLLSVNNEKIPAQPGYVTINRMWKTGDTIQVIFDMSVRFLRPIPYGYDILMTNIAWKYDYTLPLYDTESPETRNHIAVQRGPVTLAAQQCMGWDAAQPTFLQCDKNGTPLHTVLPRQTSRFAAVQLTKQDGTPLTLVDYASAGKSWGEADKLAAWVRIRL